MLGRSAERAAAADLLEEAASGHGGLLLLAGEAGIGKTTMLHAIAADARRRGLVTRIAGTPADPDRAAFSPWVQLFEEHLRELDPAAARRVVGPAGAALALLGLGDAAGAPKRAAGGARYGKTSDNRSPQHRASTPASSALRRPAVSS
jgi:AAA ATPase domain